MGKQKERRKSIRQSSPSPKNGAANKGCASTSCCQRIVFHLSKVVEIKAIFARTDKDGVCHVYSVVEEHSPATYQKVMKREQQIEEDFPEIRFSFRIRAHQGREPAVAVPLSSQPLFHTMSDKAKAHFDRYQQIGALALRMEAALPGDRDWCCVVMFYAALHLLDAYLCTKTFAFEIDSHVNRNLAIRQSPELRRFGSSYRELQDLSEQVRYDPGFLYKTVHHVNARANLAKVAAVLESRVKKRLETS